MKISLRALSSVLVSGLAVSAGLFTCPAYADDISPGVRGSGKTYSKDAPDVLYYGTGSGGRFEEAAMLRFQIDRALQDAHYDEAIAKARKACQLDPDTPENHMLYARAMTKKLANQGGNLDRKMLMEAMAEWRMLWVHDADADDQFEAKISYLRLKKTAVALAKRHEAEEKEREKAKLAMAQRQPAEKSPARKNAPSKQGEASSTTDSNATNKPTDNDQKQTDTSSSDQTPPKHKRFLLF